MSHSFGAAAPFLLRWPLLCSWCQCGAVAVAAPLAGGWFVVLPPLQAVVSLVAVRVLH